jgi:polyferredoxin
MRPAKRRSKRPTGPGEQIFVSLVVILLGLGFCLIPLFFGFGTINVRGNKGPGGAAALIIGGLFVIYGLVGLCLGLFKALRGK